MIDSIKIKNIATFDDEGISLDNLQIVNFIYGGNGSGKTTISKYLQNSSDSKYSMCNILWKDGLTQRILVYNKKFKEDNFGTADDVKGVFTLGTATQEEQNKLAQKRNEVNDKKKDIEGTKKSLDTKLSEKENHITNIKDWLWNNLYKKYTEFDSVFNGYKRKDLFYLQITNVYHEGNYTNAKSHAKLMELYNKIFSKQPLSTLQLIDLNIDYIQLDEISNNILWQKQIVGKESIAISELIKRLNISDWVHEGFRHIQPDDDICPFCQQHTLNSELKKQLEDFFDDEYSNSITQLTELQSQYTSSANHTVAFFENAISILESYGEDFADITSSLQNDLKTLISTIDTNKGIIESKIKEPSTSKSLSKVTDTIEKLVQSLTDANDRINKHNDMVNNIAKEKQKLIKEIWLFLTSIAENEIRKSEKEIEKTSKAIKGLNDTLNDKRSSYNTLKDEIIKAEKNLTSIQPSIDEINKRLKSYGFINFKIVPSTIKPNYYQIQREDGTIANETLSEGESTFISFLYYMQLAIGGTETENIEEDRVLVIDDPISSLDGNIIFVVSTILKELFKIVRQKNNNSRIKQVICLTHNVYFHKEVSFVDGRKSDSPKNAFWVLRKDRGVSKIKSYGSDNPILSSYELLWKELREHREETSCSSIQNTMRRILENYFTVFGSYSHIDRILDDFDDPEQKEIARVLIVWANDGSHGIPDDLFVSYEDDKKDVFFIVFEKIFEILGHTSHYKMMMRINESTEETE